MYMNAFVTRTKKMFRRFDKSAFTLFGIHSVELAETALWHVDAWGGLHTAMAVGMASTVINFIRKG